MKKEKETLEFILKRINKEEFIDYYINQNNKFEDLKQKYNLSSYSIKKLRKLWGIDSKNENFSNLVERVSKEDLYNYYAFGEHSMQECLDYFNINSKQLYLLLKEYNINKHFNLKEKLNSINEIEFKKYYITDKHSREDTLKHFGLTLGAFRELCLKLGIKYEERYNIPKDKLYSYYILENHTYQETMDYFKISSGVLNRKLKEFDLSKPNNLKLENTRRTCIETYGVPYHCMTQECRKLSGKSDSKPNLIFENLLKENTLKYEKEFNIGLKSYDFKVGNILIEINPSITHNININPFGSKKPIDKYYHYSKSKIAKENGFNCIHIFDWDDPNKVVNLLKEKKIIYARKCTIKEPNIIEEKDFLDKYHLQNHVKSQIKIGLYYNDELVSLMTFGKPRYNKKPQYELLRYCSKYNIIGGAEKLFSYFIKKYRPESILSYCDNSKFSGNVYKKLGFKLKSSGRPSRHWFNLKTKQHITNNLLLQRGFDQLFGTSFGKGTSNEELMLNNDFVEVYDCGQSSYVWEGKNEN